MYRVIATVENADTSQAEATLRHFRVLIVGGGCAGITVAAQLTNRGITGIAIVEPSTKHYYQPLWTLVGGGVVPPQKSEREESGLIPRGVEWIRERVATFDPDINEITLLSGERIRYDYLVVAPGIQIDWHRIEGLDDTLGRNGVSSNYRYDLAPQTWEFIRNFKGGTALFTLPAGPIKCAGAPQKIMYLAADYFRRHRIDARIIYLSAMPAIFSAKIYHEPLLKVVKRYGIEAKFNHNLISVDGAKRIATFETQGEHGRELIKLNFDLMHVTPPQSAPDFIKNSSLAEREGALKGYVKVDKATMQSPLHANIFALGDAGSAPTSKTGAAIRKQAPVVVTNLLAAMAGKPVKPLYDGYTSCPLVTGYGKLILAEFDYNGDPKPSFPFINTFKERYSMYALKRYGLPWMYWNLMLRGRT
jgi:sulfide:quinone oxidoreductase